MTIELTPLEVSGQRTIRNLNLPPLDSNDLIGHTSGEADGAETFLGQLERDRGGHDGFLFPVS